MQAIREVAGHCGSLFGTDPTLAELREQYAMTDGALPAQADRQALAAFFVWSAWAATTDRPGESSLSRASVTKGLWYARSPELIHSPLMEPLVGLRVPGDIVFAGGAALLAWYGLRLLRRPAGARSSGLPAATAARP